MLEASEAVQTVMLEDLEDSILLVRGIGYDIVSDITTNVIREPLIRYTELACRQLSSGRCFVGTFSLSHASGIGRPKVSKATPKPIAGICAYLTPPHRHTATEGRGMEASLVLTPCIAAAAAGAIMWQCII
ncbi:MAG TPA: hypothetical protein VGC71_08245 [Gaiellales bacterium]|jgi:hypothetical protein